MTNEPRPLHIDLDRERGMTLSWDDGSAAFVSTAVLRRESPSADARELRAEMSRNPFTVLPASKAEGPLRIDAVEPVGHYALRIRFSDGHDTGIYTWKYLHSLCAKHGQPPASS
ncbi:MAG: DUF971 domain-containing protein [Planctomycetota bacterium]|jgi:DUF971 family protein|nr:DUF971 domain-containing protein [Planctomycetota bacterium]